jgi:hypothetical protein
MKTTVRTLLIISRSVLLIMRNVSECIKMYRNVSECIGMYQNVSKCIGMYQNVSKCIGMYQNVSECIGMYQNVSEKDLEKIKIHFMFNNFFLFRKSCCL